MANASITHNGKINPEMVQTVAKPADTEKFFMDNKVNVQNTVRIIITANNLLVHKAGLMREAIPPAINDKMLGYQVAVLIHCNQMPKKATLSPKASLIH